MLCKKCILLWPPVVLRHRSFHPSHRTVPSRPPSSVKVTLIEEGTALVSWKPPDDPNTAVTHYTILYTSRQDWKAGEWQALQREGKEVLQVCKNKASALQQPQATGGHEHINIPSGFLQRLCSTTSVFRTGLYL